MVNPIQFIREVKNELFKVVWPSRREVVRITAAVIIFSVVMAIFLGAIDFGLTQLFERFVAKE
jgi:preprotein translocase subunit SecE